MPSCLNERRFSGATNASFVADIRAFLLLRASGICLMGLTVLLGGCAASGDQRSGVAGPQPMAMTYPGNYPAPRSETLSMKIEVEADGLPAQLALRNRPALPDDPTQPWSPNYGSVHPDDKPATASRPALDTRRVAKSIDKAPEPPRYLVASRPLDADDIIRRAIAEHEIRRNQ